MDFDDCKLEKALAEILGVNLDTIDILGLTIESNIGSDDFPYGYYVEFPEKSNIDENILANIETADIDKIPWGKTEYYTESQFSNTSVDPFGYQAEWEYEKYLQEHTPSKENIINQLDIIKEIISTTLAEIVKKSLILSSFSMAESYTKHLVWEALPISIKDNKSIKKRLENTQDKIALFKEYTNKVLKYIPNFQNVRHALAHDIINPKILENQIEILDKDDNIHLYDIFQILEDLKSFIENPIEE